MTTGHGHGTRVKWVPAQVGAQPRQRPAASAWWSPRVPRRAAIRRGSSARTTARTVVASDSRSSVSVRRRRGSRARPGPAGRKRGRGLRGSWAPKCTVAELSATRHNAASQNFARSVALLVANVASMPQNQGPGVRRRVLASALTQLRGEAGLDFDDVVGRLGCSKSKISRIESACTGVSVVDTQALAEL